MTTLRCLVIDDEPLAVDVVVSYLKQLGVGHISTCTSGIEAFQLLQQQSFDLVFLDIQMPQLTGFELLKGLSKRPLVVLTTAYREYAVEGFEWEVLDYLVKPFSFPRFLQAMEKATRGLAAGNNFLFLRAGQQWVRIDLDTLLYIESLRDYVRVITKTKTYIVHQPLADLTARLPAERFVRVHRSYTLALDRVDRVSQHCAHIGDKHIPISRAHREEVYRRLGH